MYVLLKEKYLRRLIILKYKGTPKLRGLSLTNGLIASWKTMRLACFVICEIKVTFSKLIFFVFEIVEFIEGIG